MRRTRAGRQVSRFRLLPSVLLALGLLALFLAPRPDETFAAVGVRDGDDGGSLVHLKATGPLDPLRGVPRLAGSRLQGPSLETKSGLGPVFLVQVSGPVTRSEQADLEKAGCRVTARGHLRYEPVATMEPVADPRDRAC